MHPCMQVARLEAARQSSQAQLEESSAKLRALESTHQQHLSDCSARQAAVAEREAALEQQCRQARNDASVARCCSVPSLDETYHFAQPVSGPLHLWHARPAFQTSWQPCFSCQSWHNCYTV